MVDKAPENPESQRAPMLDYRAARSDRASSLSAVQVVSTAVLTVVVVVASIALGILALIMDFGMLGATLIGGPVVGVLVGAILLWNRSTHWRGMAVGLWIGLGVAALIEGVCFASSGIR
jgi:hypothetical protein